VIYLLLLLRTRLEEKTVLIQWHCVCKSRSRVVIFCSGSVEILRVCEMQLQIDTDALSYISDNDIEHQYEMCVCNNIVMKSLCCKIKEMFCNV
jgi:hypothetical protein